VNPGNGNVVARPRGDDGGVDQDPLAPTSRRLDPDIDQI
jgi:hypothetical protein